MVYHVHELESNMIKMSILPKLLYRFHANSVKIPRYVVSVCVCVMCGKFQYDTKIHINVQRAKNSQDALKGQLGGRACSTEHQDLRQTYSKEDSVVSVQGPMEQDSQVTQPETQEYLILDNSREKTVCWAN